MLSLKKYSWYLILALLLYSIFPAQAMCGQVSGEIRVSRGKTVHILLNIKSPAPNALILTLYLPKGIRVKSSKPAFARSMPEKGQVNWLLPDIKPGDFKITCKLNKSVKVSELKASVRYKSPDTGQMEEESLSN